MSIKTRDNSYMVCDMSEREGGLDTDAIVTQ